MTLFKVHGPVVVPFHQGKGGRTITDEDIKEFWKKNSLFSKRKGAFVFGIRAAKGSTPGYVGMAKKNFKQEIFQHHKLSRYQQFLADYAKGTPILFFVATPKKQGATNEAHIRELEKYLIQAGINANPHLLNVKDTKAEAWGIQGVFKSRFGAPSKSASKFRNLMKIK